jgi:hypothetical protein
MNERQQTFLVMARISTLTLLAIHVHARDAAQLNPLAAAQVCASEPAFDAARAPTGCAARRAGRRREPV